MSKGVWPALRVRCFRPPGTGTLVLVPGFLWPSAGCSALPRFGRSVVLFRASRGLLRRSPGWSLPPGLAILLCLTGCARRRTGRHVERDGTIGCKRVPPALADTCGCGLSMCAAQARLTRTKQRLASRRHSGGKVLLYLPLGASRAWGQRTGVCWCLGLCRRGALGRLPIACLLGGSVVEVSWGCALAPLGLARSLYRASL